MKIDSPSAFRKHLRAGVRQLEELLGLDSLMNQPALIAVSGGRDSVALLHGLVDEGWKNLIVCHLNHCLRGEESAGDAHFVKGLARTLKLKSSQEIYDVKAHAQKQGVSIETAGREARLAFFQKMAKKHGTHWVLIAHHSDDQAETVLASLLRGTATGGAAGMKPINAMTGGITLLRPLLGVRRHEIDTYIKSAGLLFREDSSNATSEYRRNRLRHEVMPVLDDVMGRDVAPLLQRFALQAERDDDCLNTQVRDWLSQAGAVQDDGSLRISNELKALHPALLSRCLRWWLRDHLRLMGIENRDIEAAMHMLDPKGPAKINLPQSKYLRRKAGRLWVQQP